MSQILAILTIDTENLPENFQEIIQHEQAVVAEWKAEGILEHLYLRKERNGALLIFNNMEEPQVRALMETLPLYPLRKDITYLCIMQQF